MRERTRWLRLARHRRTGGDLGLPVGTLLELILVSHRLPLFDQDRLESGMASQEVLALGADLDALNRGGRLLGAMAECSHILELGKRQNCGVERLQSLETP